jgi:GT2 family glycosyltransferase
LTHTSMKVSIIIVSYNVKYFLDQCIASIYQSDFKDEIEIVVVDNASSDKSVSFIKEKHPKVRVLENTENVGFSKANNQGVAAATGDYLLILNPDTIISTDTLTCCLDFYMARQDAGIVGVRMYDGSGAYLPESKRGFPTPFVSFCKLFGLSQLFSRSKIFNRYYLGHLDPEFSHEVDILTGAFMFMKKNTFLEIGGFDEDYFMYGEDIDLSYRVQQVGHQNYYLPATSIIHYKGESTRKMSFDYVKRFYEAMIIFAKKHTSGTKVVAYTLAIKSAIYLNAFLTFLAGLANKVLKPLRDAIIFGGAFYVVKEIWESYYFENENYFLDLVIYRNVPIYVGCLIVIFLLLGKYHKNYQLWRSIKILSIGLFLLLAFYSLLPSDFRFSRAVLVIGGLLGAALVILFDSLSDHYLNSGLTTLTKTAVVSDPDRADQLLALLDRRPQSKLVGFIFNGQGKYKEDDYIGDLENIESICRFYRIDEIIFDQRMINTSDIMSVMTTLDHACQYKIYTSDTGSVVGSYSKQFQGQIDTFDIEYSISSPYNRFIKRIGDISLSLLTITLCWVLWPMNSFKLSYFKNTGFVLLGYKSWVGYIDHMNHHTLLPKIKSSVLAHAHLASIKNMNENQIINMNFIYAREYDLWIDLKAFLGQLNKLSL